MAGPLQRSWSTSPSRRLWALPCSAYCHLAVLAGVATGILLLGAVYAWVEGTKDQEALIKGVDSALVTAPGVVEEPVHAAGTSRCRGPWRTRFHQPRTTGWARSAWSRSRASCILVVISS